MVPGRHRPARIRRSGRRSSAGVRARRPCAARRLPTGFV